ELALQGRDKLTFLIDPPIESFGLWAEQLIAESTGKNARGIVPIVDEPAKTPGDYGQDRVFIHLRVDGANDEHAGLLASAGQPVFTLDTTGPSDLGRLFFLFEFATAVAGHVLGVNPFDQPNVQEAKDATAAALESGELEVPTDTLDELAQLLGGAAPPVYIAIQGYAKPSAGFDEAISELRELITHRTVAATTFGYGPRYLHSTGQLHKGGPPVGRFIQLIHDGERDVAVPEANFTFRSLKHAQAAGDLQALRLHDLPVVRIQLTGADAVSSLRELTGELRSRLEG
ncbi:MAG TPA: hypothetical protein VGO97_05470, partial [Solirubrobacterales bacterium]|nr:hypothetical protein [Solirubrobacterales bacterium]